jgi:hypothetical protein
MAAILDYYFHSTPHRAWVIAPEFNLGENNNPDYVIFLVHYNPFWPELWGAFELKSKTGDGWEKLLRQLSLALEANSIGRMWLVGVKGLQICFYVYDSTTFHDQVPESYYFLEPLNLSRLNETQLTNIHAKFEHCNDEGFARIALIKWELDNVDHAPYIHGMFLHMRSRMP